MSPAETVPAWNARTADDLAARLFSPIRTYREPRVYRGASFAWLDCAAEARRWLRLGDPRRVDAIRRALDCLRLADEDRTVGAIMGFRLP